MQNAWDAHKSRCPRTAGRNAAAAGLQGGALLASDDDGHEVLFTRWAGREAAEAFAKDARNHVVLPATQRLGDEVEAYAAVNTVPA